MTTPAAHPSAARRRRCSAAAVLALAAATALVGPATDTRGQPANPPPSAQAAPEPAIDDGEWKQVQDFMALHSKRKWQAMPKQQRERLKPSLVARYRNLKAVEVDAARYKAEVAVLELEDDIFGLLVQLREGQPVEPALRAKVGQLVDNRMDWRHQRLTRTLLELQSLDAHDAAQAVHALIVKDRENQLAERERRVERRMSELLKQVDNKKTPRRKIQPGAALGGVPSTGPTPLPGDP